MLVLSRKSHESVVIAGEIMVTVLEIKGNRVKLGVEGPLEVPIHRGELLDRPADPAAALVYAECA